MSEKMYRFDFYKNRKIYFAISIALIVIGILCSVVMGPKLDIQFAGGAMVKYSVEGGDVTQEEVRQTIQDQLGKDCSVAINQDISTGAQQVTVSFSGNQNLSPDEQTEVADVLTNAYADLTFTLLASNSVEATMGARFFQKCLVCMAITVVFLLVYITLRFRKIGGFAAGVTAIVALVHDVLIAFFLFVICGMSINDVFIAVILTILGYSLNSTIVIYDRVRENKRKLGPKVKYEDLMNLSLNQTLGRTLLTSLTTFLALVVVLIVAVLFNIDTVVTFALPMMAGVAAGCFSSQCIAPNLFAMWQVHKREKLDEAKKASAVSKQGWCFPLALPKMLIKGPQGAIPCGLFPARAWGQCFPGVPGFLAAQSKFLGKFKSIQNCAGRIAGGKRQILKTDLGKDVPL